MSAKWNNTMSKAGSKTWVHSAAALTAGHVVYNIKYLGSVEVSAPKGADIVKDAVTKLKFNKQVKRSEGTKPPKRELTISVDGVTIQDRHSKVILSHQEKQFSYPLHHISYCADDKSDKKICAFIAKDVKDNKHMCHVMESDKNAEEITLTVGQAFDLAYQKFLSNANKTQEQQQQNEALQKRVGELEVENKKLKQRINEMEVQQGLPPSFSLPTNGEQEKTSGSSFKSNPFNALPEPSITSNALDTAQSTPPSEPVAAINLLAELKLSHPIPEPQSHEFHTQQEEINKTNTLAEQAAAFQAMQQAPSAFEDAFNPPPSPGAAPASVAQKIEPLLPPPPPAPPRHKEPPAPIVLPPTPEPQSPALPPSPTVNGPQSPITPGIARSRPRPHAAPQGLGGVIAPPPRTLRRGDSVGPVSPAPTSAKGAGGLGIDDLYAAVSKVSSMNGSGAATSSPNPFKAPSTTEFSFGDDLGFLGNKGSANATATSTSTSSSNAFSILDLDPLK